MTRLHSKQLLQQSRPFSILHAQLAKFKIHVTRLQLVSDSSFSTFKRAVLHEFMKGSKLIAKINTLKGVQSFFINPK